MFVRLKSYLSKGNRYEYLQIVESFRDQGAVRQRVVSNLGRLDQLVASGQLEQIVSGLSRYSEAYRGFQAFLRGELDGCTARTWGPALLFGRLWEDQRLPEVIRHFSQGRGFQFEVERAVFALSLQRLCAPGSDLFGRGWLETIEAPGLSALRLQHLYRTCAFLAGIREELERELFFRDRDLFSQELELVFLDTTSTYVYRDQETSYRRRGFSRDRRADLPQFILCVAVDAKGWPVAWEIYPGNTADGAALEKIVGTLRGRFRIRRTIVVADRGMMSPGAIRLLEDHPVPFDYILGCRMRKQKEVNQEVLARAGRYQVVAGNLEVKEVNVRGKRYVVCRNPEEAQKDQAAREAILSQLEEVLSHGPKGLIGNKGYRRFLKITKGSVRIDPWAIEEDARLDGKFVLATNTDLPAAQVAQSYKSLWRVERTFREEKSTLEVRPIYHHRDDTSLGHIVASFLALRLEVDLQRRLEEKEIKAPWSQLMQQLAQVQAVHLGLAGRHFVIRTDLDPLASSAFQAVGLRPPPRMVEGGRV
jgi:Transposase DDE domain